MLQREEGVKIVQFPHMTGFGLSLERPTMIKYKIDNIREGMEISQTLYDIGSSVGM